MKRKFLPYILAGSFLAAGNAEGSPMVVYKPLEGKVVYESGLTCKKNQCAYQLEIEPPDRQATGRGILMIEIEGSKKELKKLEKEIDVGDSVWIRPENGGFRDDHFVYFLYSPFEFTVTETGTYKIGEDEGLLEIEAIMEKHKPSK